MRKMELLFQGVVSNFQIQSLSSTLFALRSLFYVFLAGRISAFSFDFFIIIIFFMLSECCAIEF